MELFNDTSEKFRLLAEHLMYVDGPIEGFLESIETGERYAFRCTVPL